MCFSVSVCVYIYIHMYLCFVRQLMFVLVVAKKVQGSLPERGVPSSSEWNHDI